jgi:hypothetical protein
MPASITGFLPRSDKEMGKKIGEQVIATQLRRQ